jgi:drug/metabolite transporter (DMT)-like permease
MKPIILASIGIVFYTMSNVIMDVKLKQYSIFSILLWLYIFCTPIALSGLIYQKLMGQGLVFPAGKVLLLIAVVGLMFIVGDILYLGAFKKSNVVALTSLLALMPVVAAITKFVWVGEIPTTYHFGGFAFAAVAVILIAIGNSKKQQDAF